MGEGATRPSARIIFDLVCDDGVVASTTTAVSVRLDLSPPAPSSQLSKYDTLSEQ